MEKQRVNNGKSFEQEVADAYRTLGYEIRSDLIIGTKQTDIIVSRKVPGIDMELRYYVECKDYQKANLSSDDIRKFKYDFSDVKQKFNFAGGILVTRNELSARVKNTLSEDGLETTTLVNLKNEALGVLTNLRESISVHETTQASKTYIDLTFKDNGVRKDLYKYTSEWLNENQALLVLLGDFGSGKTTFLQHIKYMLAKDFTTGISTFIPILIQLKDFDSYPNIEDFFESKIKFELERNTKFDEFSKISKTNDFIILLDGFDEMGLHINEEKRRSHFKQLTKIISRSKKTFLTCRPSYFLSNEEMYSVLRTIDDRQSPTRIGNISKSISREYKEFADSAFLAVSTKSQSPNEYFTVLELSGFTSEDIDLYLSKFYENENAEYVKQARDRIRTTYDLEDLAKRPILLFLIATTLPKLSEKREASPSEIYLIYTNAWMLRDIEKGEFRDVISIHEKQMFVCNLAWDMYRKSVLELSYEELPVYVREKFSKKDVGLESLVTHIQSCAFLNRDDSNVFRFSHKSFLEYFSAQFLCHEIEDNSDTSILDEISLSNEISFFLGDMCYVNPSLLSIIEEKFRNCIKSSSASSEMLRSNLLSIFSKSRRPFPKAKVFNMEFKELSFLRNTFSENFECCKFDSTEFKECIFDSLRLSNLSSRNTIIRKKSRLKKTIIDFDNDSSELRFENSKLLESRIQGNGALSFYNCNIEQSFLSNQSVMHLKATELHNSEVSINRRNIEISNCKINKTEISDCRKSAPKNKNSKEVTLFKNTIFRSCRFWLVDFSDIFLENCTFIDCKFIACCFGYYNGEIHFSSEKISKCNFIFSNISYKSWKDEEEKKLAIKLIEHEEEVYSLKVNNKTEAYQKKVANPPQLPPAPSNGSNVIQEKISMFKKAHTPNHKVEIDSLPFKDKLSEDNNWPSFGINTFGTLLR